MSQQELETIAARMQRQTELALNRAMELGEDPRRAYATLVRELRYEAGLRRSPPRLLGSVLPGRLALSA
ncbi:MAG: hypothetical protein JNM07_09765 [Phycisphaerae bacterium]|nr:hypothetical protein [Phycisphaerae bacterium]